MDTPIHVAHHLDIDIHFSSKGVGAKGEKLKYGAPGGVRVLRIRRKVMLPNVSGMSRSSVELKDMTVLYITQDRCVANM